MKYSATLGAGTTNLKTNVPLSIGLVPGISQCILMLTIVLVVLNSTLGRTGLTPWLFTVRRPFVRPKFAQFLLLSTFTTYLHIFYIRGLQCKEATCTGIEPVLTP